MHFNSDKLDGVMFFLIDNFFSVFFSLLEVSFNNEFNFKSKQKKKNPIEQENENENEKK